MNVQGDWLAKCHAYLLSRNDKHKGISKLGGLWQLQRRQQAKHTDPLRKISEIPYCTLSTLLHFEDWLLSEGCVPQTAVWPMKTQVCLEVGRDSSKAPYRDGQVFISPIKVACMCTGSFWLFLPSSPLGKETSNGQLQINKGNRITTKRPQHLPKHCQKQSTHGGFLSGLDHIAVVTSRNQISMSQQNTANQQSGKQFPISTWNVSTAKVTG